jgi:hypothetical protein
MTDGTPISYEGAVRGTPVLSTSGATIGTLDHVLAVENLDIFEGIVIATHHGIRFVEADSLGQITTTHIQTSLSDDDAAALTPPDGPPVYSVDALADSGHDMHDIVGRFFGRAHWKRNTD